VSDNTVLQYGREVVWRGACRTGVVL